MLYYIIVCIFFSIFLPVLVHALRHINHTTRDGLFIALKDDFNLAANCASYKLAGVCCREN